jgi:hypothetical protein
VILFALQGNQITSRPLDVLRIALPLVAYFAIMWAGSYALGKAVGLGYERTPPSRSPPRATTSSWPSRWPSEPSVSPAAKPSPEWSVP